MDGDNNNPEGLCKNMKEVEEVFKENMELISSNLHIKNVNGCYRKCIDLSTFCAMADCENELFVSEMLESIFLHIGMVQEEYELNEKDVSELMDEIKTGLKTVSESYKNDTNKLYSALKRMHFLSTKFGLKSRRNVDRPSEKPIEK